MICTHSLCIDQQIFFYKVLNLQTRMHCVDQPFKCLDMNRRRVNKCNVFLHSR